MGLLFNRVKNWLKNENLKATDLNAEFNNLINNIAPDKVSGFSSNVSQMQTQTNPGSQGSESLAQTESDELTRLRYVISRLIGQTYWYDTPTLSISDINLLIAQGNLTPPPNRIVSGLKRATSNQSAFLVADGSASTIQLKGAVTNFIFRVANVQYTISTNITATGLSLAPSSATALVNDATLAAAEATKVQGEGTSLIAIDTQSGNFTSAATLNTYQAFKITHGGNTEYFIGYMKDANTIAKCFRGFFFDSTSAPISRIAIADNDPITLCKLTWVFANTNGTLSATYNQPSVSFHTPISPSPGDYWLDLSSSLWKTYNGSAFVSANAMLVGNCIQDTSVCIASRSFNFYAAYDDKNTILLETQDTNTLRSTTIGCEVNVAGNLINFDRNFVRWVMPTDLDSGLSEASSTTYYAYIKDTGEVVLSSVPPYDRTPDFGGKYHPHNPWRSVGSVLNDGSSNFTTITQQGSSADLVANQFTSIATANIASVATASDANTIVGKISSSLSTSSADIVGQRMTSTGADAVGASMTATGANPLVSAVSSATSANHIGSLMTSTGADAIGASMTATGANPLVAIVNSGTASDNILTRSSLATKQNISAISTSALTGSFSTRGTITVSVAGTYLIYGMASVSAGGTGGTFQVRLSNTPGILGSAVDMVLSASTTIPVHLSGVQTLAVNDTVNIQGIVSAGGGNFSANGFVEIFLLKK